MNHLTWQIGNVKITQIIEIDDCKGIQEGIPNATKENISKISWLKPNFADDNGNLKTQICVFVISNRGRFTIVDTGVGNDKVRKDFPHWSNLKTDFLERLEKANFSPNKINFVINAHLHLDHVGWNTMLINGSWVPTFPNAKYFIVEEEFNYWKEYPSDELEADLEGIKDSVMPVFEAGLVDLIPSDYAITDEVSLIPTPGHTPGHISILIKSGGKQALITGDTIHHPCQLVHPEWETTFDADKQQAILSRKALLEQFADTQTLFIGSHFSPPTAGYLTRDGSGFKLIT